MQIDGNGIIAIFPEHRPQRAFWPFEKWKLVWTVERYRAEGSPEWSSAEEIINECHRHYDSVDEAFAQFDAWCVEWPDARRQVLVSARGRTE